MADPKAEDPPHPPEAAAAVSDPAKLDGSGGSGTAPAPTPAAAPVKETAPGGPSVTDDLSNLNKVYKVSSSK
jgi:hypothetical protein